MGERLLFLVLYIGSAALVAFLAVCLSSPRIATFRCDTGAERCELVETLTPTVSAARGTSSENDSPPASSAVSLMQAMLD